MITAQEARELNRNSYREVFEKYIEPSIRDASVNRNSVTVFIAHNTLGNTGLDIIDLVRFIRDAGFTVDRPLEEDHDTYYELGIGWKK